MRRTTTRVLAGAVTLALALGACGSDDDDDAAGSGGDEAIEITLTADGIEMPDEIEGGVVTVDFDAPRAESNLNLTKVAEGTSEEEFRKEIVSVLEGGPFPGFVQESAGLLAIEAGVTTQQLRLVPGDYIAWSEPPEGGDGDEEEESDAEAEDDSIDPDAIKTASFTVEGENDAELPELDGTITAKDYEFDIDVKAGSRYVFENEGPDQLHHLVLFNFGKVPEADVKANFVAFMQSEGDGPLPEAFKDLDMSKLEGGASGVFSKGLGGTFDATLEAGNTYVAVCFISDRAGGPPHAFGHDMWKVFTV